jgi:hypothetical protein
MNVLQKSQIAIFGVGEKFYPEKWRTSKLNLGSQKLGPRNGRIKEAEIKLILKALKIAFVLILSKHKNGN